MSENTKQKETAMKLTRFGKWMAVAAVVAITAVFVARAAEWKTGTINVPAALSPVNNQTLATTTGTAFTVPQGCGMTFQPNFTAAGAGVSNVVFGFNGTADGTNWSTTVPLSITNTCNGTTNVIGAVFVSAASLAPYKQIRLDQVITTQGNNVTINGFTVGFFY